MRAFLRVHLVDGNVVDGAVAEETTAKEFEVGKKSTAEIVMRSGGWQINTELPNGNWAVFPKQSILYLEFIVTDDEREA